MRERPILFSGSMVRAILDGRKVQTRRTMKGVALDWMNDGFTPDFTASPDNNLCHYGQIGDLLWVRECFADESGGTKPYLGDHLYYRADLLQPLCERWTPSIHMPRWASRITLEITGVRIERLNEISGKDAAAEGVTFSGLSAGVPLRGDIWRKNIDGFRDLWESINGAGSWDANPWVWVIEFRIAP